MSQNTANELEIVNLTISSLSNYMSCFEANGNAKNETHIKWQFFENPVNKQFVSIAVDAEKKKTAAIYAIFPVSFKVGSESLVGSQSLDTITDVDYRGQGLFIKLAKEVYQKAADDKVCLVYGFPNGNSIHGFAKKLDWHVLDPVPFLIKPLRTQYFSKKISLLKWLPNFSIPLSNLSKNTKLKLVQENKFPKEVDSLWTIFSKHFEVALNRNHAYLNWRYIDKPDENYKITHCYADNNDYLGFVVYVTKDKHEGKIGYLMELIYDTKRPEVAAQLMNHAIQEMNKEKADCILSWCLEHSPNYAVHKKRGFFKLPEKLRPIELHFGASSFNTKYDDLIYNRANWYLSYSDSDTV